MDTIAALPCLQAFKILMNNFPFGFGELSPESAGILSAIIEQFPNLRVHSDHENRIDRKKLTNMMKHISDIVPGLFDDSE